MTPLFSIVVPYRNRAATLLRCLDSLVRQEIRPIELVLIDNGSTDDGAEICKRFAREHQRPDFAVLLLSEATSGASAARNAGLAAARGAWVSFFDSDDEMSPSFLSEMQRLIDSDERARWVLSRSAMVFDSGQRRCRAGWRNPSAQAHILGSFVSTQSWVAQRSLLLELAAQRQSDFAISSPRPPLWNEDLPLWNDYELGLLLLLRAPTPSWHTAVFHRLHQHADSITGRRSTQESAVVDALRAVRSLVLRYANSQQDLLLRALRFRLLIVRQQFQAAPVSSPPSAPSPIDDLLSEFGATTWQQRCAERLLTLYLRRVGKAAWRLALALLASWR